MRFLKLKTLRLALILAVVTLVLHLGTGYLIAAVLKNQMLAGMWQRSLKVYWPALDLIQIFRLNVNVGFVTATASMILAALLECWVVFAAIIWVIRFYFREPPITAKQKIAIITSALIVAFCFFKMSSEAFGDPRIHCRSQYFGIEDARLKNERTLLIYCGNTEQRSKTFAPLRLIFFA